MQREQITYCRYAPSLGALEGTPQDVWGTPEYHWRKNRHDPCVFFGMYDLRDYLMLWQHRGKAYVLWAGSDITNLSYGFLLNDGKLRTLSVISQGLFEKRLKKMLMKAEHYVENTAEAERLQFCLQSFGLAKKDINVIPSYMGNTDDLKPSYKHDSRLKAYLCSPQGREAEYGFSVIERIADKVPEVDFYLYGSNEWKTNKKNIIVRGRVTKEVMNDAIKDMQVAIRLNFFDGFSEIVAKGILLGQHVITRIPYTGLLNITKNDDIVAHLKHIMFFGQEGLNKNTRQNLINTFNKYPWYKNI